MAASRLEKIGNIYTRIQGLLKSGAMRWEDRPLFYDIYTAFPPLREHKFMEDAPKLKVRDIFYPEDQERAQNDYSNMPAFDMNDKQPRRSHFEFRQNVETEKPIGKKEINLNTEDIFKES